MRTASYQRWIWIDLLGFDRDAPDHAVGAYLAHCGFVPDAISLLLCNPDFVHDHDGFDPERVLPYDCCAYGGHPDGYDRARQDWTAGHLRGLIDTLHRHGIAVYCALFDLFGSRGWIGQHPEVWHVNHAGQRFASVCPYKRLADGTFYEDFFAARLTRALADYGFDGFHQGDGLSHPRLPIYAGDYSDDLIEQLTAATGLALPDGLGEPSGDDPEVITRRGDWLWRHARRTWLDFYADRTTRFGQAVADALHAAGKRVVLNNALTRDPFEGRYRFGTDYHRLGEAGADAFIAETVAPGVIIGAESGMVGSPHYDFQAMLMLLAASLPNQPVLCLNGTHDIHEQWDVLRHGPALLEREITCQANLYRWLADGTLTRCSAGPVVCLGDGLQAHEWAWLNEWWDRAFAETPRRLHGATLVWSDALVAADLAGYLAERRWPTHKLLHELTARGAPVHAVARVEDLDGVRGPLLVLNPQHFPAAELQRILAYDGGPRVLLGDRPTWVPPPEGERVGPALACAVYGAVLESPWLVGEAEVPLPGDLAGLPEPPTYVQNLWFPPLPDALMHACVTLLQGLTGAVVVRERPDVIRVQTLELADGRLRLLIANDDIRYVVTIIDVGRPIASAEIVGSFPRTPPTPDGSTFRLRVPGQGLVVVDVRLET